MKSESNESLYGCVKLVRCRRRVSARRRQTHEIIWIQDYDPIIMIVFPWSASRSITFPIFLISLLPSPEVDSSSIRILSFWDSLPRTFASLTRCDSPQERFIDNYPSFKYLLWSDLCQEVNFATSKPFFLTVTFVWSVSIWKEPWFNSSRHMATLLFVDWLPTG